MMVDKRKEKGGISIPTSSMSDIAFLLLTFFLVTTSLDLDKGLGLTLPPQGDPKPIPRQNIASILVNESGAVMIDEEIVEVSRIKDIIKQRLAVNDKLTVSIKTNSGTKYQTFMSVLDQVQMAEARRISIAEPEK